MKGATAKIVETKETKILIESELCMSSKKTHEPIVAVAKKFITILLQLQSIDLSMAKLRILLLL